jgi:hypothetical protein
MEVHRILGDGEGFALPGEKASGDAERRGSGALGVNYPVSK